MSPWWLAAALAASEPTGGHHHGTVEGDTVRWHSEWRARERCVRLAAPFAPPAPYTLDEGPEGPLLCRPEGAGWSLDYARPFPSDTLDLPLPADTLQRIDVTGGRFESPDRAMTKHLQAWTTPGITRGERKQLDRSLPKTRASTRLYVRPSGALTGRLRPPGASQGVVYGALGLFVAIGAVMGLAYRVLERGARRERFDRWLSEAVVGADEPPR